VQNTLSSVKNARARINEVPVLQRQLGTLDRLLEVVHAEVKKKGSKAERGLNDMEAAVGELDSVFRLLDNGSKDARIKKLVAFWHSEKCRRQLRELTQRIKTILDDMKIVEPGSGVASLLEQVMSDSQARDDQFHDQGQLNEELPFLLDGLESQIDPESFRYLKEALADARENGEYFLNNETVNFAMEKIVKVMQARDDEDDMHTLESDELLVDTNTVLGKGGFGSVFLGRYGKKPCAVKILNIGDDGVSDKARNNLRNEVKIWRDLKHQNIVQFYGAAIVNHRLMMAIELCDFTLDDIVHRQHVQFSDPKNSDAYVGIARGICRAVAHLHANFIIHRDIKPQNVMLNSELSMVKLTDFGMSLAKEEIYGKAITATIRGTPVYMAPEVCAPPAKWTKAADVYALSILLWEIFTGVAPFEHESSTMQIMQRVIHGERPPLSEDMPHWLWKIMEAGWHQTPERRPTAGVILAKFEKHSKETSRTSGRVIGFLLDRIMKRPGGGPSRGTLQRSAPTAAKAEEPGVGRYQAEKQFRPVASSSGNASRNETENQESFESLDSNDQVFGNSSSFEGTDSRASFSSQSSLSSKPITKGNHLVIGGMFGLELWDAHKGKRIKMLSGHNGPVFSCKFSVDGDVFVTGSGDKTAKVWDQTFKVISTLKGHKDGVLCVCISKNSNIVVTGSADKTVKVWNRQSAECIFSFTGHQDSVSDVEFLPDESKVISASIDRTIKLWSMKDLGLLTTVSTSKPIKSLAMDPDGTSIVTAHGTKHIKLWKLPTLELQHEIEKAHSTDVNYVAWEQSRGKHFATASRGGTVRIWSARSHKQVRTMQEHSARVDFLKFSPKGGFIASCSRDHSTRVWNVKTGAQVKVLNHETMPLCVVFSPFFLH